MRNQTDELQRPAARVTKLVRLVGRDEDYRAGRERMFLVAFERNAAAFEHEHLMLVVMRVLGGMPADSDFELTHAETGRPVGLANETTYATAHGTLRIDRSGFNFLVLNDFHDDNSKNRVHKYKRKASLYKKGRR